ncbi:hypothetical protein Tco_0296716 [Tanacetum coccineum]
MALSIADQIALDDALVAPTDRLKIGKCNLRLSSDITSKEATLQVVYDVLKLTPFYKAFQVTADAPEIYMQEFWASAYVHNRSVRFKMNNKKHIIGLEQFRDILQICPKVGNKKFVDPPLESEIIIFLASLGHSGDIRKLSDVNVNKLHQPWRSFAAVINKCLCGTPSYDSLRLSQAQILWGMYNKKSVDYAYLLWEDFIFKIETKNTKKGSAMYYPRFTKLVVNYVMEKDPSIPRRNKVNWHYARDDPMFTTINVISRNEATQLRIIAVTMVEIVEWHDYKHLDWITVRRDDDVLYKFKEGDFHRLRIQDIEDMLLLLVQGKVTNLSVEERIAFNVSLRMFTRRVVIQRRVEDLQLGVESYQKKLNLTKPDTYRSNLRRQDAYTPYSDPRGFIYENKDKKNRLMRIDELHKFSDGTLDDVRTALNDRLKGIRMEYLPQTFWSQRDKANARAMIQAIDKRLKTRRIMRSLERFVGGRPYGGDLRLLQRTI